MSQQWYQRFNLRLNFAILIAAGGILLGLPGALSSLEGTREANFPEASFREESLQEGYGQEKNLQELNVADGQGSLLRCRETFAHKLMDDHNLESGEPTSSSLALLSPLDESHYREFSVRQYDPSLVQFEERYRAHILKKYGLKLAFWHFYEDSGLWFVHVELQSKYVMTDQVAKYAVVQVVEDFLDEIQSYPVLTHALRIFPPSVYHLRLTLNAPDRVGYVREIHARDHTVTYYKDDEKYCRSYSDVFSELYPGKKSRYAIETPQQSKWVQQLSDGESDFWLQAREFWKGYQCKLSESSWGKYPRFHISECDCRLFADVQAAAGSELSQLFTLGDMRALSIAFSKVWRDWCYFAMGYSNSIEALIAQDCAEYLQLTISSPLFDRANESNAMVDKRDAQTKLGKSEKLGKSGKKGHRIEVTNIGPKIFIHSVEGQESKVLHISLLSEEKGTRDYTSHRFNHLENAGN